MAPCPQVVDAEAVAFAAIDEIEAESAAKVASQINDLNATIASLKQRLTLAENETRRAESEGDALRAKLGIAERSFHPRAMLHARRRGRHHAI